MKGATVLIPSGEASFSGVVRGNATLDAILELLKTDTTRERIIAAMKERFDAPEETITEDVGRALSELERIGALEYMLGSGTYGTLENMVRRKVKNKGRLRYLLGQAIPNLEYMKISVSFVDRFPFLYPLGILWRWGRIFVFRRPYLRRVLRVVFRK